MEEVGAFLKRNRLEKKIELKEISEVTKISIRYLEGIEKGDWSMMPGKVYAKGFIRSYAKALQVDITSFLMEIDSDIENDQITSVPISPTSAKPVKANRFGKLFATSLVVILIIVIMATIIYYVSNIEREEVVPPSDIQEDMERPDDLLAELEPLPEKEQPIDMPDVIEETQIQFIERQQNTFFYEVSGVDEIAIRIEAISGDCWYEIRSSNFQGNVIATNTLRNGNEDIINYNDSTWLSLGNPRAVNLYIDNQMIEIEDSGQSLRFQFNFVNQ